MIISSPGDEIYILNDLSADLEIGIRTLQRTVIFYRTYRRPPRVQGLTWAHSRVLTQLDDPDERAFYESLATDDALSAKRLTIAINGNRYAVASTRKPGTPIQLPRPTDPSYLYKAEPRDIIDADTLLLDIGLGFEVIRRQRIRLARVTVADRPRLDFDDGICANLGRVASGIVCSHCDHTTLVGVFRPTAVGRHHGDDKGI